MGNIFPLIVGLLASILLALLSYLTLDLSYLVLFIAFLIPYYMVKYLDEVKPIHHYLAAFYSVLCFLGSTYVMLFMVNYYVFVMNAQAAAIVSIKVLFKSLDIFQWLILIVMPIISYRYLKMKS